MAVVLHRTTVDAPFERTEHNVPITIVFPRDGQELLSTLSEPLLATFAGLHPGDPDFDREGFDRRRATALDDWDAMDPAHWVVGLEDDGEVRLAGARRAYPELDGEHVTSPSLNPSQLAHLSWWTLTVIAGVETPRKRTTVLCVAGSAPEELLVASFVALLAALDNSKRPGLTRVVCDGDLLDGLLGPESS